VFDETGLEVGARDFMKQQNKIMSYVCESFRKTAINLVVIVPSPRMLDVNVRNMADFWAIMEARGRARVYKTKLKLFSHGIKTPIYCKVYGAKPSPLLSLQYEAKRKEFLSKKYEDWEKEVKLLKGDSAVKSKEKRQKALDQVKQEFLNGKIRKKSLGYRIQELTGLSQGPAYLLRRQLLREIEAEEEIE
jgi:hypothetical protein